LIEVIGAPFNENLFVPLQINLGGEGTLNVVWCWLPSLRGSNMC